jgi:hypothetical protein
MSTTEDISVPTPYAEAAVRWAEARDLVAVLPSGDRVHLDPNHEARLAIATGDNIHTDDIENLVDVYRIEAESRGGCPVCLLEGEDDDVRWSGDPEGEEGDDVCDTCRTVLRGFGFDHALRAWRDRALGRVADRRP